MAFKPKTNISGTDTISPSKLRALLRQTKLHNSTKPEEASLFQMLDSLAMVSGETKDALGALQNIVNNLVININNITNITEDQGQMMPMDGINGEDAILIPGPKGDKGDSGIVLMQFEDGIIDETWIIMTPTP